MHSEAFFPTSRYPAIPLVRPLLVFGKSFKVELSSNLTLNPDTVMRAAIGKSLQTILREEGKLLPFKQFCYGVLGRHQLSKTTRATIRSAMGPLGDAAIGVIDGVPGPEYLDSMSDWSAVAFTWGVMSTDSALDVIVKKFIELDNFASDLSDCISTNGNEAGGKMFQARFGSMLPAWSELCPHLQTAGCLGIETSLHVVAELDAMPRSMASEGEAELIIADYLAPTAKPIGHWLREVAATVKCNNNKELAYYLARRGIVHNGGRPVTHDTLKGWSAMKPGSIMSLDGCQALLKGVLDQATAQRLLCRFALARFLAFLCDFLRSCVNAEAPSWQEAQRILLARYRQITAAW